MNVNCDLPRRIILLGYKNAQGERGIPPHGRADGAVFQPTAADEQMLLSTLQPMRPADQRAAEHLVMSLAAMRGEEGHEPV